MDNNSKNKFIFNSAPALGAVEENYIKFLGDNLLLEDQKFLDAFKETIKSKLSTSQVHARFLLRHTNRIIIETSRFSKVTMEYIEHQLFIFIRIGNDKYDWVFERYRVS